MDKESKIYRTLSMFLELSDNHTVNKYEAAAKYGVKGRTIQRDIDDIRVVLEDHRMSGDTRYIEYDRMKKGFVMTGNESALMTNSEILAVVKILLESRAFTKREMSAILEKLVKGCVPLKNMELVSDLIANEKYHYVELRHKEYIQDKLWSIGNDIHEHNLVQLRYARGTAPRESIKRIIEPLAIIFSEYYFYLNAFIVEKNSDGKYVHKYSYPAIFRIDRIKNYKTLNEKFKVVYANRFQEGEFRKRIQFMYAGKLMKIKMKYYGANPEAVLDRLPTARVIEEYKDETIIEAEVYGNGIIMWLLSQTNMIEVLEPETLREDIKKILHEMLDRYE